jgi:hypothetical protein
MWIQSRRGFTSAVKKNPSDTFLTVRFRALKHAKEWVNAYPELGKIIDHEGTDYPYRVKVDQSVWAEIQKKEILAIDYSNFKGMLDQVGKPGFHNLCMKVWTVFFNTEAAIKNDKQG